MTINYDLLSTQMGKWIKSMLNDFILSKSLPTGVKLSDDLSLKLNSPPDFVPPLSNSRDVANILQSIVSEIKNISMSNLKMRGQFNYIVEIESASDVVNPKIPLIGKPMQMTQPSCKNVILAVKRSPFNCIFKVYNWFR